MTRTLLILAGLTGMLPVAGQESKGLAQLRDANQELLRIARMQRAEGAGGGFAALIEQRAAVLRDLMKKDPAAALAHALPEQTLGELRAIAGKNANAFLETHGTWAGTYEHLIEDDEHLLTAREYRILRSGGDKLELNFTGQDADDLTSGSGIIVRGMRLGEQLAVEPGQLAVTSQAAAACGPTGAQNVLTILVNLPNYKLASNTLEMVKGIVLGNSATSLQSSQDYSVDDFWQENSDGKTWVTRNGEGAFTVTGPFELSSDFRGTNNCDTDGIRAAALAAVDPSVYLPSYTRIAIVFPSQGCSFAGLAYVGCIGWSSQQDGAYRAGLTWLRSDQMSSRTQGVQLWTHELGHTLGMGHASTRDFGSDPLGPIGSAGSVNEYGDAFSTMGSWNLGFYAAPHAALRLNWIDYQTVESGGTYTVRASETRNGGVKALRIRRGTGNAFVWVEFRQGVGKYNSTLPSQVFRGALIHYEDSATGSRSHLADFTPATDSFSDPALVAGQTWTDPYSDLRIRVDSISGDVMTVTVIKGGTGSSCTRANPTVSLSGASSSVTAGQTATFSVTVRNNDSSSCANGTFTLSSSQPAGWPTSFTTSSITLAPGASQTVTMTKSAPSTASGSVTVDATAASATGSGSASTGLTVNSVITGGGSGGGTSTGGAVYLSDLTPIYVTNGWGPMERDRSNAEAAGGDGRTLTLNGRTFAKGLGVHAASDVRYNLNGAYATFQAVVGVDDEVGNLGSVVFEVWKDGVRAWSSPRLTGADAGVPVTVDVAGTRELRLVVLDGGDGIGYDHANWADAAVQSSGGTSVSGTVFVSDLTPTFVTNAWGPLEKDRSNGESALGDGRALTINGQVFNKGLGVHASSDVRYNLNGAYATFSAVVGVDDEVGGLGSVVFEIWKDGVRVWASQRLTGNDGPVPVSVNVAGARELRLVVTDGGDGIGWDHANWADAKLSTTAALDPYETSTLPASQTTRTERLSRNEQASSR